MKLIVYTNYMKDNTGYLHIVEMPMDYFSYYQKSNELLVFKEDTGFVKLDVDKIRQIGVEGEGMYCNSIFFNVDKKVEHLPKNMTQEEILNKIIIREDY